MLFVVVLETEQSRVVFGSWQIIPCPKQITLWLALRPNKKLIPLNILLII